MRKFSESYSPDGKPKKLDNALKNTAKAFKPSGNSFTDRSDALKSSDSGEQKPAPLKKAPSFVPKMAKTYSPPD